MTPIAAPDAAGLAAAVEAIEAGLAIIIPTDTVYGLAVRAGDPAALDAVFELKRRPLDRSIAVLVSSLEQAHTLAVFNSHSDAAARRWWPGALTLVVPRLPDVDPCVGRADGTVGIRCPDQSFAIELARSVGPLATTSANLSGEATPARARAAAVALDGEVALIVDAGPITGVPSTVARIDGDGQVTVFRQGAVQLEGRGPSLLGEP